MTEWRVDVDRMTGWRWQNDGLTLTEWRVDVDRMTGRRWQNDGSTLTEWRVDVDRMTGWRWQIFSNTRAARNRPGDHRCRDGWQCYAEAATFFTKRFPAQFATATLGRRTSAHRWTDKESQHIGKAEAPRHLTEIPPHRWPHPHGQAGENAPIPLDVAPALST